MPTAILSPSTSPGLSATTGRAAIRSPSRACAPAPVDWSLPWSCRIASWPSLSAPGASSRPRWTCPSPPASRLRFATARCALVSPRCRPSHAPSRGAMPRGMRRSWSSSPSTTTARWGKWPPPCGRPGCSRCLKTGNRFWADRGGHAPLPVASRRPARLRACGEQARLCRAGREAAGLEGVSPALRAWASNFGKTRSFQKMHQRSSPPLIRPTSSGSFGSPTCPTARADGPLAFAIHGFGQSPLRTSLFSRQIGSSCARPLSIWPIPRRRSLDILSRGLDKRARLSE